MLLTDSKKDTISFFKEKFPEDFVEIDEVNARGYSSNVLSFDVMTSVGFPVARITELYGEEGSGKSTLCAHLIANNPDLMTLYFDAEHGLDVKYLAKIGVNLDNLIVSHNNCGEQIFDIIGIALERPEIGVIVVDSVAAMITKEELDGEFEVRTYPLKARMMAQGFRRIISRLSSSNVSLIFINQIIDSFNSRGASYTTPGGKALKFYASLRVELGIGETIMEGDKPYGNLIRFHIRKNKCGACFNRGNFVLSSGNGIDITYSNVLDAINFGIIKASGSWFEFNGDKFQGKFKMVEFFKKEISVYDKLKKRLIELYLEHIRNSSFS